MSCLCGSQKRSTAPDTINPVNIGSLCFLFGVEGVLCQFLDLIPETIKAVLDANKINADPDKIFSDWVKKFAKTGYNLVIDEATGDIDLTSFCSNPPPPLPEDINFSDIFIFVVEVVKILDLFFKTNDILSGDDTRLIDKVTGYWLFKQWYENCECKKCPEPPPDQPPPPNTRPDFNIPVCSPCPDGSGGAARCKNLRVKESISSSKSIVSCHGFWVFSEYSDDPPALIQESSYSRIINLREYYVPLEVSPDEVLIGSFGNTLLFREKSTSYLKSEYEDFLESKVVTDSESATATTGYTARTYYEEVKRKPVISANGSPFRPFDGDSDGYIYSPCPPCTPPPPPPPEFCDIYPDHPDCVKGDDDDNENCDHKLVLVGEFTQCGVLRSPKNLKLIVAGDLHDVAVVERVDCESVRSLKVVQYLECTEPPPPDPCEGVDCASIDTQVTDQLNNARSFGEPSSTFQECLDYILTYGSGQPLFYECCSERYIQEINQWLSDNPPPEE